MAAKFTDRELRLQALMLDDPYDQPDLAWEIGTDTRLLDILNLYRYRAWPAQKAYCVACRGHHHKMGFTCVTNRGERMMFGSSCGADIFGESWTAAEQRMKERVTRQGELIALDRMKTILGPMQRALRKWVGPIEALAYRRIGFRQSLPELYERCEEAAQRSNGTLMVSKKVKIKLGNEPDWVEVPYARLPGAAMFDGFDRLNVVHIVEDAQKAIQAVAADIYATDSITTPTLRRRRLAMERSFEQLEVVAATHEGAQEFYTAKTYALLAEWSWARDVVTERYIFEKGALTRAGTNRGVGVVAPLPELDHEILDLIREYRRAD